MKKLSKQQQINKFLKNLKTQGLLDEETKH